MFVGDVNAGDSNVVCLQETSKSGTMFSIADIASGTNAGTYYTKGACSVRRPSHRHAGLDRLVSRPRQSHVDQ